MFAGVAYETDEKITESSSSFSLYSRAPDRYECQSGFPLKKLKISETGRITV